MYEKVEFEDKDMGIMISLHDVKKAMRFQLNLLKNIDEDLRDYIIK